MTNTIESIRIRDIREFGIVTCEYNDFILYASEELGEIVINAVSKVDSSNVTTVYSKTLKEARESIKSELDELSEVCDVVDQVVEQPSSTHEPVVTTSSPKKTTNVRGEESRNKIAEVANKQFSMTEIEFEKRGKYNDWYIIAIDASGDSFVQRLDVFKKKLKIWL